MKPMKQVAPLRYDVIFKKAFSHPNIFTALVKDFLGIQLEIDEVKYNKGFVPSVNSLVSEFDLFVEDKKNQIIVEMKHAYCSRSDYERFVYYQCSSMVEAVINSNSDYDFPMTIITIVFFTWKKTPSPDSSIIVHDFESRDLATGQLLDKIYQRKHQLIFVFTNDSTHENTPSTYREWMQAIDDSLDSD